MFVCFFIIGFDTIHFFLHHHQYSNGLVLGAIEATESLPPWTQTASRTFCLVWQSGQTTELMFMDQAWEGENNVRYLVPTFPENRACVSSPCSVHAWQPDNLSAIWFRSGERGTVSTPIRFCLSLQLLPPFMEKHDLGISHRQMSSQIIHLAWAFKSSSPSVPPSSHNEFQKWIVLFFQWKRVWGKICGFGVWGWFCFCLFASTRRLSLLQKED